MNLVEMKEGLDYIQDICEKENNDYLLYCEIFKGIRLGDTGTVKCTSLDEIEYCKNIGYKNEEELQQHIDSLSLVNKFCIIPYPDDLEYEYGEDYLIFIRYQLDGTRGEESNVVMDSKYFIEMVKNGFRVTFEKDDSCI